MTVWSLTQERAQHPSVIVGTAVDEHAAHQHAIRALQELLQASDPATAPSRFQVHLDGQLIAIIAPGTTPDGMPDHDATLDLLGRLYAAPCPC